MGIVRFAAILLAIVAVVSLELSASGFENSGVGTKARGMAGAFRAIADDWTAAYYNPAGYAYAYDNQLGGNVALVHWRNELVPRYKWGEQWRLKFGTRCGSRTRCSIIGAGGAGEGGGLRPGGRSCSLRFGCFLMSPPIRGASGDLRARAAAARTPRPSCRWVA